MTDFTELWPGGPVFAQADSFRLSTDSVLLADFIYTGSSKRGIDLGCGAGILALLLLTADRMERVQSLLVPPLLLTDLAPGDSVWRFLKELGIRLETQREDRGLCTPDFSLNPPESSRSCTTPAASV